MQKEKRKKHKIVLAILIVALMWLFVSGGLSALESLAVQTMKVNSSDGSKGYDTLGFVCVNEVVIAADSSGTLTPRKEEGKRIAKDHAVFSVSGIQGERYYYAPISGMVSYQLDGYETIKTAEEIAKLDLQHIYDTRFETDTPQESLEEEQVAKAKVIQTMKDVLIYMKLPQDEYLNALEVDTTLKLMVQGETQQDELRGKVVSKDACMIGDAAGYVVGLNVGTTKEWLYNERVVKLRAIYEESSEMVIPKTALITQEEETGVYYLRKKFVVWQSVTVVEERDEQVVIEGLEEGTEIVLNPQRVTEGKYVR